MGELRPAYMPEEAAKILGVSRSWVIQKAATDEGRAMGAHRTQITSGHWRFDPDAFDRYVRDLRAGKVRSAPKKNRKGKSGPRQPRNIAMNTWLEGFKRAG